MRQMRVFLAALAVLALAATAGAFFVAPLKLISAPSPFAGCTIGATGTPGETLYTNAVEEPWVDINPTKPANLIAVFQQDRWSNGGAHGLATSVSHNGGATWSETFAHFSLCAGGTAANGGDFERSSDPWVSFSPNGDAYQISLSVSFSTGENGILVSKSGDG
ncbi:MAG TPA: hypothetical protein VF823_07995, partial [Anaerolineales bacterium]